MPKLQPYFAYGSNLNTKQFKARCPNSRYVGNAVLRNYEFIIASRGFATVIPCRGSRVEGCLCELTTADERTLDRCEGVKQGCYRKEYLPVQVGSKTIRALVYIDNDPALGSPEIGYVKKILLGAADRELSMAYQKKLFRILTGET